uniref:Uncharacterized protein n=1 Tax=Arundo donax TaxID=35708 RepID=A0A0A9C2V9_ARUDO
MCRTNTLDFEWPVNFTGMLRTRSTTMWYTSETVPIYCNLCSAHGGLYRFFAYACEGMMGMRSRQVKLIVFLL